MDKRPNIVVIFTDQQRFDTIHALGNPVIRTPALDRLCREGVSFTSAYSPSPVCVSARCSLHYGQYPAATHCYENQFPMPDDRPSFMRLLTDAGYRTHGIGKCHFRPDPDALRGFETRETQEELQPKGSTDYQRFLEQQGFGWVTEPHGVRGEMYYTPQVSLLPPESHPTAWIGDRSTAFIREQAGQTRPWMLFSSFIHPHPPFAPPAPWHKLYRAPLMPLPKTPPDDSALLTWINRHQNRYKYRDQGWDVNLVRGLKAHYYACISFLDWQVGRLLEALDDTGQADNTLVLFTSDHGELLGDYHSFGKRSMHDSCARIPLLARLPGLLEGGQRCDLPVSLVDVAPTLLAAAGVGGMKTDGIDLAAAAACGSDRPGVFIQHARGEHALYTLVTRRWKYAYSAPDNREFLFDRVNDPEETRNRAGLVFCQPDLADLRRTLMATLREAGEVEGLDGEQWKRYPVRQLDADPDRGLLIQDPPGFKLTLPPGYCP
jgi:arylsulfatase